MFACILAPGHLQLLVRGKRWDGLACRDGNTGISITVHPCLGRMSGGGLGGFNSRAHSGRADAEPRKTTVKRDETFHHLTLIDGDRPGNLDRRTPTSKYP